MGRFVHACTWGAVGYLVAGNFLAAFHEDDHVGRTIIMVNTLSAAALLVRALWGRFHG